MGAEISRPNKIENRIQEYDKKISDAEKELESLNWEQERCTPSRAYLIYNDREEARHTELTQEIKNLQGRIRKLRNKQDSLKKELAEEKSKQEEQERRGWSP